jgi:hypothetical protein
MQVQAIYVCRGTERFQLPLSIPDRDRNRIRHTVCLHRSSGTVHDFGCEDWFTLRRSQRIRNAVPSKLMITSFGYLKDASGSMESLSANKPESEEIHVPAEKVGEPCPDNPAQPVCRAFREPSKQICEGWAPPPIDIHGPKFRDLSNQEKTALKKLHQNLGHPNPNVLAEHLKAQHAAPHVVEAAREFVCDAAMRVQNQLVKSISVLPSFMKPEISMILLV